MSSTLSLSWCSVGAVRVNIRLQSIDKYIVAKHGRPRALTPNEDDLLESFAQLITQAIRDQWPVDTGTSRDRWTVTATGRGGDVGLVVENPMFYAEYVHDELYARLIPQIWNAVKRNLIAGLKLRIDETEKRLEQKETPLFGFGDVLDLYREAVSR